MQRAAVLLLSLCLIAQPVLAKVSEEEAVRCIMGEARGESFAGKVGVAEVIRKRGSTAGLYGCKAKFKESKRVWDEARRAWKKSAGTRTTKDADMFENVKAFGWPKSWDKKKVKFVTKVDNHDFFKKEDN